MLLLLLAGAGSGVTPPVGDGVAGPVGSVIHIEWSPTTVPMEAPVWVDLTPYVRFGSGVSIDRGRSSELDQFKAGSMSLVLDNRTRLFDPSYAAGTYFGDVKPMRRIRCVVELAGSTISLFSGFIIGWPQEYDLSDNLAVVPIDAKDGFEILANTAAEDNFLILDDPTFGRLDFNRLGGDGIEVSEQLSGARIDTLLTIAGWSTTDRSIDDGLAIFSGDALTGSILSNIRRAEVSEDGFFFFGKDGKAIWRGRDSRWNHPRMTTTQITFADDGADIPYSRVASRYDRDFVVNDVTRAREGGVNQTVTDADSIREYGRRKDTETNLLLAFDAEARSRAEYRLKRYKDPLLRPEPITVPIMGIPVATRAARFAEILNTELLDRAVLERRPMGGTVVETTGLVQSLGHQFDTTAWSSTFALSPGDIDDTQYFILDDPTHGLLDVGVLGY